MHDLDRPAVILPHLCLGTYHGAASDAIAEEFGFTRILTLTELPPGAELERDGFTVQNVPMEDGGETSLRRVLPTCVEIIDGAAAEHTRVLVHCVLGVNRSPAVVIAYLMVARGWTLEASYAHVHRRRTFISPHDSYLRQLGELEVELFGTASLEPSEIEDRFPAVLPGR